tara:strand:- start:147 stop:338 length:192 start_codon:yes stop_codon:yes gene_type:complete
MPSEKSIIIDVIPNPPKILLFVSIKKSIILLFEVNLETVSSAILNKIKIKDPKTKDSENIITD